MSLLQDRMTPCQRLIETGGAATDRLGGTTPRWTPGEIFPAALVPEGTTLAEAADRQAPMGRYAVLTPRAVALRFHDVFRRLSDGATFRVLSSENHTPPSAGLDLRSVKAERWEVPH